MKQILNIPGHFLFTQYSLATFDNCPLKFRKRYMENLKWNSFPDENTRRRLEMGNSFHLLAYRHFMGIDPGLDGLTEGFEQLGGWVESLRKRFKISPEAVYLPEYKLRMAVPSLRLEANFDLLVVKDGRVEIWDWKTHGGGGRDKKGAEGKRLRDSLQTMVYMFVLKEQSALVAGKELECDKIAMHYWQPDPPMELAEISYSDSLHREFREVLEGKIEHILTYDYAGFDKALYSSHCKYCEFNWFCNNERVDFNRVDETDDFDGELDWEGIEEKF